MALFKKKKNASWADALCINGQSFLNYTWQQYDYNFSFNLLYGYYANAAPVADAIDRIAKEFASIEPKIYDNQQERFVKTNFLEILENPNSSMTKQQFLTNIATNYQICNNILLYGIGVSGLQEINYIEPNYLTLYGNVFNILDRIVVNKGSYAQNYTQQTLKGQDFFVAQNQVARMVRGYSPSFYANSQFGLPKLQSISYEIEQFLAASRHNLSLLCNIVKPSAVLQPQAPLTSDQQDKLQANLKNFYSGARNSGQALMLPASIDFKELGTRVDSDFQTLRDNVERSIYQRLEIPLALITNVAMTYNNLEVAKLQLYDNAVLPLAKTLYKQLQDIIFYYGKIDPIRYSIWYDENEIEALAVRKSQLIKDKAMTNSYTMNEIRQMYGDKDLDADGNTVYIQSTMIPAASNNDPNNPQNEVYVDDGVNEPSENNSSE